MTKVHTDPTANLYSGAPLRGHVPVLIKMMDSNSKSHNKTEFKLNLNTMDWLSWAWDIEMEMISPRIRQLVECEDEEGLWNALDETILKASSSNCQTKRSSAHSKPYWTEELTKLSHDLRKAQKTT